LFVFCHDFCKKDKNPAKTVLYFFANLNINNLFCTILTVRISH